MIENLERNFAGRRLRFETGRMAKQASGSAVVQHGETMVLAAVTVSDKESHLPFFPLTVEYREKTYAAGKIPGGFFKREGRPAEQEILAARVIDRSIRPLFPEGFHNEVQVFVYVLSADQENDADVIGLIASSLALSLSPVPWSGPIGGVRIGRVDGNWVMNPTFQQLEMSDLDFVVAGHADSIMMVEGAALEISESDVADALAFAQSGIAEVIDMQREIVSAAGKPKMEWSKPASPTEVTDRVSALGDPRIREALNRPEKAERAAAVKAARSAVADELAEEFADNMSDVHHELNQIEYRLMRQQVLEQGERIDGRDLDTVRPISCDVGVIPRSHGSALFTRGQTQALVNATLGTVRDEQRIDNIHVSEETTKSFMLHYNFPPFSVGEVRMIRGVSRR